MKLTAKATRFTAPKADGPIIVDARAVFAYRSPGHAAGKVGAAKGQAPRRSSSEGKVTPWPILRDRFANRMAGEPPLAMASGGAHLRSMTLLLAAFIWIVASVPAPAQVAGGASDAAAIRLASAPGGCQPGQVLLANGDSCIAPVSVPTPNTALYGPTPAEMSRLLSAVPQQGAVNALCLPGQVLQPNGQPCVPSSRGK
jgi:hypothetical protein